VFYAVVTPIGVVRRLWPRFLRLRAFKAGDTSVMHARGHVYVADDLEKPY
jgi:hypothetical protein